MPGDDSLLRRFATLDDSDIMSMPIDEVLRMHRLLLDAENAENERVTTTENKDNSADECVDEGLNDIPVAGDHGHTEDSKTEARKDSSSGDTLENSIVEEEGESVDKNEDFNNSNTDGESDGHSGHSDDGEDDSDCDYSEYESGSASDSDCRNEHHRASAGFGITLDEHLQSLAVDTLHGTLMRRNTTQYTDETSLNGSNSDPERHLFPVIHNHKFPRSPTTHDMVVMPLISEQSTPAHKPIKMSKKMRKRGAYPARREAERRESLLRRQLTYRDQTQKQNAEKLAQLLQERKDGAEALYRYELYRENLLRKRFFRATKYMALALVIVLLLQTLAAVQIQLYKTPSLQNVWNAHTEVSNAVSVRLRHLFAVQLHNQGTSKAYSDVDTTIGVEVAELMFSKGRSGTDRADAFNALRDIAAEQETLNTFADAYDSILSKAEAYTATALLFSQAYEFYNTSTAVLLKLSDMETDQIASYSKWAYMSLGTVFAASAALVCYACFVLYLYLSFRSLPLQAAEEKFTSSLVAISDPYARHVEAEANDLHDEDAQHVGQMLELTSVKLEEEEDDSDSSEEKENDKTLDRRRRLAMKRYLSHRPAMSRKWIARLAWLERTGQRALLGFGCALWALLAMAVLATTLTTTRFGQLRDLQFDFRGRDSVLARDANMIDACTHLYLLGVTDQNKKSEERVFQLKSLIRPLNSAVFNLINMTTEKEKHRDFFNVSRPAIRSDTLPIEATSFTLQVPRLNTLQETTLETLNNRNNSTRPSTPVFMWMDSVVERNSTTNTLVLYDGALPYMRLRNITSRMFEDRMEQEMKDHKFASVLTSAFAISVLAILVCMSKLASMYKVRRKLSTRSQRWTLERIVAEHSTAGLLQEYCYGDRRQLSAVAFCFSYMKCLLVRRMVLGSATCTPLACRQEITRFWELAGLPAAENPISINGVFYTMNTRHAVDLFNMYLRTYAPARIEIPPQLREKLFQLLGRDAKASEHLKKEERNVGADTMTLLHLVHILVTRAVYDKILWSYIQEEEFRSIEHRRVEEAVKTVQYARSEEKFAARQDELRRMLENPTIWVKLLLWCTKEELIEEEEREEEGDSFSRKMRLKTAELRRLEKPDDRHRLRNNHHYIDNSIDTISYNITTARGLDEAGNRRRRSETAVQPINEEYNAAPSSSETRAGKSPASRLSADSKRSVPASRGNSSGKTDRSSRRKGSKGGKKKRRQHRSKNKKRTEEDPNQSSEATTNVELQLSLNDSDAVMLQSLNRLALSPVPIPAEEGISDNDSVLIDVDTFGHDDLGSSRNDHSFCAEGYSFDGPGRDQHLQLPDRSRDAVNADTLDSIYQGNVSIGSPIDVNSIFGSANYSVSAEDSDASDHV